MASGATLKAMPSTLKTYKIINLPRVSNVTITGGNIVGDRSPVTEAYGMAYGHCISMTTSTNIHISNINISACRGDGIYQGVGQYTESNSYTYFDNVNISNVSRMGLTYISVKNSWVNNLTTSNIGGLANAGVGIDFEPNDPSSWLQNIHVNNASCTNCVMKGLKTAFAEYSATPNPVDITVTNFSGTYNNWLSYGVTNHNIVVSINGTTYKN